MKDEEKQESAIQNPEGKWPKASFQFSVLSYEPSEN
jgi:hypothetical protein